MLDRKRTCNSPVMTQENVALHDKQRKYDKAFKVKALRLAS